MSIKTRACTVIVEVFLWFLKLILKALTHGTERGFRDIKDQIKKPSLVCAHTKGDEGKGFKKVNKT